MIFHSINFQFMFNYLQKIIAVRNSICKRQEEFREAPRYAQSLLHAVSLFIILPHVFISLFHIFA